MRSVRFLTYTALAGALTLAGEAAAQGYGQALRQDPFATGSTRARGGNYGGGFIEMLMTGRDPAPPARGGGGLQPPRHPAYGQRNAAAGRL